MAFENQFGALALDASIQSVIIELQTPAAELPPQPLGNAPGVLYVEGNRTTTGTQSIVTATAGQFTRVHLLEFTCTGACTVELTDGSGGTSLFKKVMPGAGGYTLPDFFIERPIIGSVNTALHLKTIGTGISVDMSLYYRKAV